MLHWPSASRPKDSLQAIGEEQDHDLNVVVVKTQQIMFRKPAFKLLGTASYEKLVGYRQIYRHCMYRGVFLQQLSCPRRHEKRKVKLFRQRTTHWLRRA
eukprot:scaffold205169_cov15-Tisochrysis_lutea.AAC.1